MRILTPAERQLLAEPAIGGPADERRMLVNNGRLGWGLFGDFGTVQENP